MAIRALDIWPLAALVAIAYTSLIVYRLFFHPLARFPGPRLAAATAWYEFYQDVVRPGKLVFKLQELHNKYGPIIRVTPRELHILDSEFYDALYAPKGLKPDKDAEWVKHAFLGSIFATAPHELHRMRRAPLNPFFSKRSVAQLEPVIEAKVDKLCKRFKDASRSGAVIRLDAAFMALTTDVITDYAFAKEWGYLDDPDFALQWLETIRGVFQSGRLGRQFPWMKDVVLQLPHSWVKVLIPPLANVMEFRERLVEVITKVFQSDDSVLETSHRTIFHEIKSSNLPPQELELGRVAEEAAIITSAGAETTARTLTLLMYYLRTNPEVLQKLRSELAAGLAKQEPNMILPHLEQLPYLSAVIQEGIRLSYGVTSRLPRVVDEPIKYRGWTIPPRTPVSMEPMSVLMDPKIFTEPDAFKPERWLDGPRLDKYFVPFGRGTRQCIGMNLAYAELYLTLNALVTGFDLELFETSYEDIRMEHDFFTAASRLDSKGVRVTVKARKG